MSLYSYVVRYDSGFAPNPFYGFCTLATCKPKIRATAQVGDWIVGSGSGDRSVQRSGFLVYAMRVTETLTFDEYALDARFFKKIPYRRGSRKQSCGDNIYSRSSPLSAWQQRDSFHSLADGGEDIDHTNIDTAVNRILISEDYVYFGGMGPLIPDRLRDINGRPLCKAGIGHSKFDDAELIGLFTSWLRGLQQTGFQGAPHEWLTLRR